MGGNDRRKPYAVLIALLILLSIGVIGKSSAEFRYSDIIIVDDDGSADYSTIEQALQAAQNSDSILVRSGLYQEQNLIIDKTVSLIGEDASTTIIQGDGSTTVLIVEATGVSISNVTLTGGGGKMIGANLDVNAHDCIISDNIIIDSEDVGIAIHHCQNTIIEHNVIINCPFAAIRCYENSARNIITKNQITDCINGILVTSSVNQYIHNNMVSHCSKGIYLEESNDCYVELNQLYNNQQGMFAIYAAGNTITQNNFIDNIEHAKFATWLSPTGLQLSTWDANYWDNAVGSLPKWIPGILFIRTFNPIGIFFPWGTVDWHPVNEPYTIDAL